MRQYENIAGTKSYVGVEAAQLLDVAHICSETFARYGYEKVILPILERSDIFLQRSGEEIRRRMYILQDPGGKEVCLRPEMTISAARAFLETMASKRLPARLSYQGEVFRYDKVREGRYRQFVQAGVEHVGSKNRNAADVEVVALALETVRNVGIEDFRLLLGDLALTTEFINSLPISAGVRTRLLENFWRREAFDVLLEQMSRQPAHTPDGGDANSNQLAEVLSAMGENASHLLVRQILSLFVEKNIGHRDLDEIAERFLHRFLINETTHLPAECLQALREFFSISGPPENALAQLRDLLRGIGAPPGEVYDALQRRIELLTNLKALPRDVQLDLGFRRGIDYYSGFIFEIHRDALGKSISQVCGGGRYDQLFSSLGAAAPIPAVGFALGVDRLLLTLREAHAERAAPEGRAVDAVVVTVGRVSDEDVWGVAQACRRAGWKVRADFDGRRLSDSLGHAAEAGVPFVVIAGEDELNRGSVKVRDMGRREEITVPLPDLEAFVRSALTAGGVNDALSPAK